MFVYNNNNNIQNQNHKTLVNSHRRISSNRAAKGKASLPKRATRKQGKSLSKTNTQFLKSLGLVVRKRQK